jgi:hypothetical protein
LVVGDVNNISDDELDLANFFEDEEYLVNEADENDNARTTLKDFLISTVLLSSSSNARANADDYFNASGAVGKVSVVVMNPDSFVEMNMVSDRGNNQGTANGQFLDIRGSGIDHPITKGLNGRVQVFDRNVQMNFGTASGDADCLATINGNNRECAIMVFEPGARMVRNGNGNNVSQETTQNRIVGFFLRENNFNDLRNQGEDLLVNAVSWAYNATVQ